MRSDTNIIHALGRSGFYFSYFCWGIVAFQCSLVSAARQSGSCMYTCVPPRGPHPTHSLGPREPPAKLAVAPGAAGSQGLAVLHRAGQKSVSVSQFIPPLSLPLYPHVCSPHMGLCSHLQIGSSVPFSQSLHTCTNM